MKRFRLTLLYFPGLIVLNFFHPAFRSLLAALTGEKFIVYLVYALFISFFIINLVRVYRRGKNTEAATVLLLAVLIFFFLSSRPRLLFKLSLLEFFVLGVILFLDYMKSRPALAYSLAWLTAAAVMAEIAGNLGAGTDFYYFDVWMSVLFGLCGYVATGIWQRK